MSWNLLSTLVTVNWEINLTNILLTILTILIFPAIRKLIITLIELKSAVNELNTMVGRAHPPTGALGEIAKLWTEVNDIRDWLLRNTEFDRRRHGIN